MLAMPSLGKRPIKVPDLKTLRLFFLHLCMSKWKDFYENAHTIESRSVTGPSTILFAWVYVCTFQPGNFTGWGSEGVNALISLLANGHWQGRVWCFQYADSFSLSVVVVVVVVVGRSGSVPTDQFQPFRLRWQMMAKKKVNPPILRVGGRKGGGHLQKLPL